VVDALTGVFAVGEFAGLFVAVGVTVFVLFAFAICVGIAVVGLFWLVLVGVFLFFDIAGCTRCFAVVGVFLFFGFELVGFVVAGDVALGSTVVAPGVAGFGAEDDAAAVVFGE